MGRTIPSFRSTLEMEKQEWKPFRAALSKKERKAFDDMWDIPMHYITACSNSVSFVPLQPIVMSILFHHYKQLTELKTQIEQMQGDKVKAARDDEYVTNTATGLDRYFIINSKK